MALIRDLCGQGRSTFSVADARVAGRTAGMADSYLALLLHRLERAGWLHRIKHGVYAVTTGLPGFPEAHAFAIGMALVDPCAVSGWAALNHHGLTDQIPHVITLTTPKRVVTPSMRGAARSAPSAWDIAGNRYEIVIVVPAHFFGDEEIWVGGSKVRILDRERALLDCFALPRRFGGLGEGMGMIEDHSRELDIPRLVSHALRYGSSSVARRVGYILERLGFRETQLAPLLALPMRGYRLLDPTRPPRGRRNARWGLVENLTAPRRRSSFASSSRGTAGR